MLMCASRMLHCALTISLYLDSAAYDLDSTKIRPDLM